MVALLLHLADFDEKRWAQGFAAALPGHRVILRGDDYDPAEIDYIFIWKPAPDAFDGLVNLKAVLSLGAGVDALYVHARKAWLKGLSPKENRTIPPLDYDRVHRLRARLAPLPVMINGGLDSLEAAEAELAHVDGVMLGRAAYHNPMLLAEVDRRFFGAATGAPTLEDIIAAMAAYADRQADEGVRLNNIARHMLGLANGMPGARQFRQILSVDACKPGADSAVFYRALDAVTRLAEAS